MVTKQQYWTILDKYDSIKYDTFTIITDFLPKTLFIISSTIYCRLIEINKEDIITYDEYGDITTDFLSRDLVTFNLHWKVDIVGKKHKDEMYYFVDFDNTLRYPLSYLQFIFHQKFNDIVTQVNNYNLPFLGLSRFSSWYAKNWSMSLKDLSVLYRYGVNLSTIDNPGVLYSYKTLFSCSLIEAYNYYQTGVLDYMEYPLTKEEADRVRKDIRYCSAYIQAGYSLMLYRDYIRIIDSWNITDRKHYPRYPKDFSRVEQLHDNLVLYVCDLKNHVDESFNLNYQKEYYNLAKKFEYSNDNYSIIACKDLSELHYEEKALNHCVGSYIDSVGNGREYILFLRKNDDIETPFYTVDVTPNNIVRQIHGKCNCNVIAELEPFIKEWASKFNLDISNYSGCKVSL